MQGDAAATEVWLKRFWSTLKHGMKGRNTHIRCGMVIGKPLCLVHVQTIATPGPLISKQFRSFIQTPTDVSGEGAGWQSSGCRWPGCEWWLASLMSAAVSGIEKLRWTVAALLTRPYCRCRWWTDAVSGGPFRSACFAEFGLQSDPDGDAILFSAHSSVVAKCIVSYFDRIKLEEMWNKNTLKTKRDPSAYAFEITINFTKPLSVWIGITRQILRSDKDE